MNNKSASSAFRRVFGIFPIQANQVRKYMLSNENASSGFHSLHSKSFPSALIRDVVSAQIGKASKFERKFHSRSNSIEVSSTSNIYQKSETLNKQIQLLRLGDYGFKARK